MGQVSGVQYAVIAGSSGHGLLFHFGDSTNLRAVWIHRGHVYRHDREARIIAIPESLLLEKVLDAFRVDVFPPEEKCTS